MSEVALRLPRLTSASELGLPGLFISVEGGDGSGKTTQLKLLEKWLAGGKSPLRSVAGKPRQFKLTREPGGTELGVAIRHQLMHAGHVAPKAEALLYAGDRAHHIATTVLPSLSAGDLVITDRYLDSSIAYQGSRGELEATEIEALSVWATNGLMPDLTLLLDVSAEVCQARRESALDPERSTPDRIEQEAEEFHEAVRASYRQRAAAHPDRFVVIDASGSINEVATEVKKHIHAAVATWELRLKQGALQ